MLPWSGPRWSPPACPTRAWGSRGPQRGRQTGPSTGHRRPPAPQARAPDGPWRTARHTEDCERAQEHPPSPGRGRCGVCVRHSQTLAWCYGGGPCRAAAGARRVAAALSREIVRCAQETLHAWTREPREGGYEETRRRCQQRYPPPLPRRSSASATALATTHTTPARREPRLWTPGCRSQPFASLHTMHPACGYPIVHCTNSRLCTKKYLYTQDGDSGVQKPVAIGDRKAIPLRTRDRGHGCEPSRGIVRVGEA
jgi:hypothetical protein